MKDGGKTSEEEEEKRRREKCRAASGVQKYI